MARPKEPVQWKCDGCGHLTAARSLCPRCNLRICPECVRKKDHAANALQRFMKNADGRKLAREMFPDTPCYGGGGR